MELPALFCWGLMTYQSILQSEFFLLQPRQQIFVGVNPSLLGIYLRVERCMLG